MLRILALLPIPLIVAALVLIPTKQRPAAPVAGQINESRKLPSGWELVGKQQEFDKKTLFDRIDGAAPPYIKAGFVRSLGADYRKQGFQEPITVDAYDMGTAAQAFGMYARERDPSYKAMAVGEDGYLSTGSLNFWRGQYYFKLAGFEEGEKMDKGLVELAKDLAAAMKKKEAEGGAAVKATLQRLPTRKRKLRTEGYSLPPLDGVAGLSHAYYAMYERGDAAYRLWLIPRLAGLSVQERTRHATEHWTKAGAKIAERPVKLAGGEVTATVAAARDGKVSLLITGSEELAGGQDVPEAALDEVVAALAESLSKASTGRKDKEAEQ